MRIFVLFCVIIVGCDAAPISESEAKIIQYDNSRDENGNYNFRFETSNGIHRSESGRLVNAGQEDEHIKVQGYYSYVDLDGKLVEIHYTADENGFHIEVPSIVASAPIPPAALATLLGG